MRPASGRRLALRLARLVLIIAVAGCAAGPSPVDRPAPGPDPQPGAEPERTVTRIELLGVAEVPRREVGGTVVGGLSALVYEPETGAWLALSDDGGERSPARFYRLTIDLADGRLDAGDVAVTGVTTLADLDGEPFAPRTVDPEGLVLSPAGTLFVSSEGNAGDGIPPFVREVGRDGRSLRELAVPEHYRPRSGPPARGVRQNLAFESLTLSPDGRSLWTATESALAQDGPTATLEAGAAARMLRFDVASGRPVAELLYRTEPIGAAPRPADGFAVNGLVELLALGPEAAGGERFLALERSYSAGAGHTILLFEVSTRGAEPLTGEPLAGRPAPQAVEKRLLLDLGELGVRLDNFEALAFGPPLADGRRTLVILSDDNFNPAQRSLALAFAVGGEPLSVSAVQGAAHRSPLEGEWVAGVEGIVTAIDAGRGGRAGRPLGFWVEATIGDGDPATSEGLPVDPSDGAELPNGLAVGDRVELVGRVEERGFPGALSVTTLAARSVVRTDRGEAGGPLPPPVQLGTGGRTPPDGIDDDGLDRFEPSDDAIDFFESLEGMRVEVAEPPVVGPTASWGGFAVLAGSAGGAPRTAAGGVLLRDATPAPAVLTVDPRLLGEGAEVDVGDRFQGPLTGVVDYRFGGFRLVPTEPLPAVATGPAVAARSAARPPSDRLTIATYNAYNLAPDDPPAKLARLAASIAGPLGAPDVVALQEMQDASGAEDDGVVDGGPTFEALIGAIETAGGPRYDYRQIDPLDNSEGGQPGGNIRVGLLFRPDRVSAVDRGTAGPAARTQVIVGERGPALTPSPGRVAPTHPCFAGDEQRGYEPTRRSLAVELDIRGRQLFVVINHLKSKRGDDPLFGATQPPGRATEEQRSCQARLVAGFAGEILALDREAAVVVLGDMNEVEGRQPLAELAAPGRAGVGLVALAGRMPESERYSYVFEGRSQLLDHVFVSPALTTGSQIEAVHVNADLAVSRRASDHDPVLVRIELGGE